jgi:hypothetical protein
MTAAPMLASAIKDLASTQRTSFATTQAVWRFLKNDRISFQQLNQPIETIAIEQTAASLHQYALVVHDWSSVRYTKHSNKLNRLERKHQYHSGAIVKSGVQANLSGVLFDFHSIFKLDACDDFVQVFKAT